ncbi:hypothetical protein [Pseudomonas aeruginosa]|uniref:hypothetical protein n=1 Tax=Pseudomonas aeruginosa TaxID=287 RepID=UPI0032B5D510
MSDLRVNKDQWDSLSKEEQDSITKGLVEAGAIKAEDRVVADSAVPPFDENTVLQPMWNPIKDLGPVVCDVAAAAGAAWCAANTAGIGLAACMALAEAGRKKCKEAF